MCAEGKMNKKLKPWFIGSIVCAAMLAAALIILGFDGSFTDMKISTMMRVGFPAAWAMFFSVWSSCGFVGTAIELRTGRRAVLPVFLGIMPLLLAAQTVWAHLDYSPGGMLNFSSLALALRLIMYTAPGIIMLIADVALIITRLRKKPSPPEAAGEAVCFTKLRALYIILFVVFALPPFAFVAGCVGAQEAALIGAKHEQRRTAELAVEYYKAADDMIDYCNDMYLDDTIFGLPLRRPTALIDYDEMRVTFLISTYKDEMLSYRLERVSEEPPGLVHFVCQLEGAGREFRLYIFDEGSGSRVCVTVEMNDGSLWYADMNGERPLISSSPAPTSPRLCGSRTCSWNTGTTTRRTARSSLGTQWG